MNQKKKKKEEEDHSEKKTADFKLKKKQRVSKAGSSDTGHNLPDSTS